MRAPLFASTRALQPWSHPLAPPDSVYALSQAFSIPLSDADPALALAGQQLGDLTCIARQGSGSACRSLFGGFVRWEMGAREDGADSRAVQVAPADHWPELQLLILVAGAHAKEVPSTDGMQASVATSPLLAVSARRDPAARCPPHRTPPTPPRQHRASSVVPDRLRAMEAAYLARDFETFATLTMQASAPARVARSAAPAHARNPPPAPCPAAPRIATSSTQPAWTPSPPSST